jgi:hypothetical protein
VFFLVERWTSKAALNERLQKPNLKASLVARDAQRGFFEMVEVNISEVVAEVEKIFQAYERALVGNDIRALNELFWESPLTMRYGVRELLYSHAEIAKFRTDRGPIDQRRTLRNTRVTTFGRDFATANTEYIPHGSDKIGRQSQTWVRTNKGWKIVSAHVSLIDTS